MTRTNPFLGARPYGPADENLFFGRSDAAARLVDQIDLRPLTILTSPSGLGKTSLLRAAVMPELERSGLSPVYIRPDPAGDADQADAAMALLEGRLSESLALALLPDPKLEIETVSNIAALGHGKDTLGKARCWFNGLPAADDARANILGSSDAALERISMLARYLRGSLAIEALAAQVAKCCDGVAQEITHDTPLTDFARIFQNHRFKSWKGNKWLDISANNSPDVSIPDNRSKYSAASEMDRALISPPSPEDSPQKAIEFLCGFSHDGDALLARPDGDTELCVRLVIIIDQFEQIFTLSRPESRGRVFEVLVNLLTSSQPVHLVLSLRKEWYADLVQLLGRSLRMNEPLDRTTFHLQPMTQQEAEQVMTAAPAKVGVPAIGAEQRRALWTVLEHENAIDAVVLSIACHELFAAGEDAQRALDTAGVEGLLRAYLLRALGAIADDVDRDEAFDILGAIAGTGLTRGFVTQSDLMSAPLRDRARRIRVLEVLQRAFLVKGDSPRRGYDKVFDIMHERLLTPVRELFDGRPEITLFREATEAATQANASERGLSWRYCCALLSASQRIVLDSHTAGILLSSIIRELNIGKLKKYSPDRDSRDRELGLSIPPGVDPQDWLRDRYRELAAKCAASMEPRPKAAERTRISWWMTQEEITKQISIANDSAGDELALKSVLQGPVGLMSREIGILARRLLHVDSTSELDDRRH